MAPPTYKNLPAKSPVVMSKGRQRDLSVDELERLRQLFLVKTKKAVNNAPAKQRTSGEDAFANLVARVRANQAAQQPGAQQALRSQEAAQLALNTLDQPFTAQELQNDFMRAALYVPRGAFGTPGADVIPSGAAGVSDQRKLLQQMAPNGAGLAGLSMEASSPRLLAYLLQQRYQNDPRLQSTPFADWLASGSVFELLSPVQPEAQPQAQPEAPVTKGE